jgi:glyoxylase-like metal-dependent hydrolase (beta-lactamase superfamily II)
MTRRVPAIAIVVLILATSISGAQERSAPDPAWQISHVRGGLYRVNAGLQVTVFFVTGDGIVLVDPLSSAVSAWLKQELANRFPQEPVRYVVYTQHHFDRASGGGTFDETAEHVAHESFSKERARSAEMLPAPLAALDANKDGRLDRDEVSGTASAFLLGIYDHNEDRSVTPGELYSFVRSPESTYRTRRTLTVNGKTVELIYVGTAHAADMTAVYFPAERVLFGADLVSVRSMPSSIGADPRSTIASIQRIEGMAFDTLLTGNGEEGAPADIGVSRDYLQELTAGVRAGFNAGLSVEETKRFVTLEKFSSLSGFSTQREANIAELYAGLRPVLTNVYGAVHLTLQQVQLDGCQPALYDSCVSSSSFPSFGGAIGLDVSIDRLTIGGEISSSQPKTTRLLVTDSFFDPYEHVFQYRDTMATFLAGYRLGRSNGTVVTVQGGMSLVSTRSRLTVFSTRGSGGDGSETSTQLGPTLGATILARLGDKYSIVVPVRLTIAGGRRAEMDSLSFTAGAGLLVNVSRSSR